MTLAEFLLARLAEDRERITSPTEPPYRHIRHRGYWTLEEHMLKDIAAKRRIVELHQSWPVLVQRPPEIAVDPNDLDSLTLRMSQQMAWLTQQAYRDRFGDEPPTAPILRELASVYVDHPDYQEEWR